jgi:hypothetical protein
MAVGRKLSKKYRNMRIFSRYILPLRAKVQSIYNNMFKCKICNVIKLRFRQCVNGCINKS